MVLGMASFNFLSTIARLTSLVSKWAPRQPRRAAERVASPSELVLLVKQRPHVGHQHYAGPVLGSFDSHCIRPERVAMVARATGRRVQPSVHTGDGLDLPRH